MIQEMFVFSGTSGKDVLIVNMRSPMSTFTNTLPTAPSPQDIELATQCSRKLGEALAAGKVLTAGKKGRRCTVTLSLSEIPETAVQLLQDILVEMARGNPVSVIPARAELTTQQAADFLSVSRPFLVNLLEENKIPYRKVGTHRRVRFEDLAEYKRMIDESRRAALDELSADAQELDMGY